MSETASQAANKGIDAISGMPDAFTVVAVLVVVLLAVLAGFWIYLKNKPEPHEKTSEGGEFNQETAFVKLAGSIDSNTQSNQALAKLVETLLGGQGEKLNNIFAQGERTQQMIVDHHLEVSKFIASQKE